jgi:mono/diheme cytochrome c family protein
VRKAGLVIVLILVAGAIAVGWWPAISPIDPPNKQAFEPGLVRRGESLAAMGNCGTCHTRPGGKGLEGGLAIPTPFGNIYSTNITPDPETGIGRWPEAAFARAMREGVDLEGNHLYPAFPYDHFTLLNDDDIDALYAYVMTRDSIKAVPPVNDLKFPFNFRPAVAIWKALYFSDRRYQPDPKHDGAWNRGAYLSEGLAHCGACHTPRNALGAENQSEAYNGAPVEGWYAYAINAASPAPVPWTEKSLEFYLSRGWEDNHGLARGPMAPVVTNLSTAPHDDVKAMATYIASLAPSPSGDRANQGEEVQRTAGKTSSEKLNSGDSLRTVQPKGADQNSEGAVIYDSACASCHESGRPLPFGGLNLSLSSAIHGPTPTNIINVTLFGLAPNAGSPSPIMPGFHGSLTDRQAASLLSYLHGKYSSEPPWPALEQEIAKTRLQAPRLWPSPSTRPIVANSSQEVMPW